MRSFLALGAVIATCAVPAAAIAKSAPIALLHTDNTTVRAFAGVQAWSDYDATDKRWHVVVRRNGQLSLPAIAPSTKPIEVDVGPGAGTSGNSILAYVDCTANCRVVVSQLDGSAPHTVPGSSGASHPALSGNQVAWVRGRATVMTSGVDGSARKALPGAPKRKCYQHVSGGPRLCEAPRNPRVDALSMHGSQLAMVTGFELNDGVGASGTVTEVRTESVEGGAQKLVALMDVGEGDEHWLGPSWAQGKLFFLKTCNGCHPQGVFRFDPARNTYAQAPASGLLNGFAIDQDGRHAFETTSDSPFGEVADGPCDGTHCAVTLTDRLTFTPVRTLARQP